MKTTHTELKKLFQDFHNLNILVIGDVMIDAYLFGKVSRISPEAPVPVVEITKKEARLGGAANVALNLQALGANPVLCSVVGDDDFGASFIKLLKDEKLDAHGIMRVKKRKTTVKTRIVGNNHQMLRIDDEDCDPIENKVEKLLIYTVKEMLDTGVIHAIIFEDYDKGVITETLIKTVVNEAHKKNVPVAVDPKKNNFLHYKNVDLFKPNLRELKDGLKVEFDHADKKELDKQIKKLHGQLKQKNTLVTLSEYGVYASNNKKSNIIPAHVRKIADVSGAGDTVISVATLCLALKKDIDFIATISNLAGGLVCEKVGVAPINKAQLYEECLGLIR